LAQAGAAAEALVLAEQPVGRDHQPQEETEADDACTDEDFQ